MNEELKQIKKIYGENFSHFCRDNFGIILEEFGILLEILKNRFAPTKSLYQVIIKSDALIGDFKNYIYEEYYKIKELNNEEEIENKLTPFEIMESVGYKLIECKKEQDIQSFKKYYRDDELICTIRNGGRLNRCYVFFAVKNNVSDIKREDFKNPYREDLYSTSVLSIQFPKLGYCSPSIISRYNHTLQNNPNATYGCDLNKIAPGLEDSFKIMLRERGLELNGTNKENLYLPGYVKAGDGKYYKYNMEVNGMFYCENNVIIDHGYVRKFPLEKYLLIDYFLVDLVKKKIMLYDHEVIDSFVDEFDKIKRIKIEKTEDSKNIIISKDNYDDITITIDKNNQIVGYKNTNLEELRSNFLFSNQKLRYIEVPNVKYIHDNVLRNNVFLKQLNLPYLEKIDSYFLFKNTQLEGINIPNVKTISNDVMSFNSSLQELNLPEAIEIGPDFMFYNKTLKKVYIPKVKKLGGYFLRTNILLTEIDLPEVEEIGMAFLVYNEKLQYLSLPKAKKIGDHFLDFNKDLKFIDIPLFFDGKNNIENKHIKLLLQKQNKKKLIRIKNNINKQCENKQNKR